MAQDDENEQIKKLSDLVSSSADDDSEDFAFDNDQIKKLEDFASADDPDEPALEVFLDRNLDIRVFSADECESREYRSFALNRDWGVLIDDVYYSDEFNENQAERFSKLIESTFKFLLPDAESDSLLKDTVSLIMLMYEFETQDLVTHDVREARELAAARTLVEALRIQAVRRWEKIDGVISDKYLKVIDADDALHIVDMENINLSELAQQFQHSKDNDSKEQEQ